VLQVVDLKRHFGSKKGDLTDAADLTVRRSTD
jgi:hypothetical protein